MKRTKRILSIFVCIALIMTSLSINAYAAGEMYSVEADCLTATSGSTINYSVYLNDCSGIDTGVRNFEFTLSIPSGLTFVSGTIDANLSTITGFNMPSFNATAKKASSMGIMGTGDGYKGGKVKIMTFSCTVDEGISGNKEVSLSGAKYTVGTTSNSATVLGATVNITKAPITTASATVDAPSKGVALDESVTVGAITYSGTVQWYEGEEATGIAVTGKAKADQVYTAKITLTPDTANGENFANSVDVTGTYTGTVSKDASGNLVFTQTFGKTDEKDLYTSTQASAPSAELNAGGKIVLAAQDITGETVEYAKTVGGEEPTTGWQDSTTFEGLTVGTTYTFWARVKETEDHKAGTAASAAIKALEKTVTNIVVTAQPTDKAYEHGGTLDTTGMKVKVTYNDSSVDDNFLGYTVVYPTGKQYFVKGDTAVYVTAGDESATITDITVSTKELTITGLTATDREYDGTQEVVITGGNLDGRVGGEDVSVTMPTSGTIADANAGDDKVVTITKPSLSGADKDNYTLKDLDEVKVNISQKDISTGTVITLGTIPTYDGGVNAVSITSVKNGDLTVDYDLVAGTNEATNVESKTLKITGKGNFTGTATKNWSLEKATAVAGDFDITAPGSTNYTGSPISVSAPDLRSPKTGIGTITVYYEGAGYDKSTTAPKNAGTYTVTFDVAAGTNYNAAAGLTIGSLTINKIDYDGTKTASTFVRSGQTTTDKTVTLPDLPDGASYASTGTAGGAGATLIDGTPSVSDGVLKFNTTNQADGTVATITVNVTGATNYNTYDVVVTVTAKAKEEVTISGLTYADKEYDGTVVTPTGTLTVTDDKVDVAELEIIYEKNTGSWTSVLPGDMKTAGEYRITYKVGDDNEDYMGETTYTFKITPKALTKPTLSGTYTYNGYLQTASLEGFYEATMTKADDAKKDAGNTDITVSLKDGANYKWSDDTTAPATIAWNMAKAELTVKPKNITITKGSALPTAVEVEYVGLKGTDEGATVATLASGNLTAFEIRNADDSGVLADSNTAGTYKIKFAGSPEFNTAANYTIAVEDGTLTIKNPSSGGGYIPPVQKPTIEAGEGVKVTLSSDGTVATITVDPAYELADVVLNGTSKGKVTEVKGLKTGDKLAVTATKKATEPTKEDIIAIIESQQLVARSKVTTSPNGKKAILITWYDKNGNEVTFDGVQIFRSTKRNSGYGTKPIFTSVTGKYYNTAIKAGTKYYYKVRGFVEIDGQKYYTEYSLKAIRTAK